MSPNVFKLTNPIRWTAWVCYITRDINMGPSTEAYKALTIPQNLELIENNDPEKEPYPDKVNTGSGRSIATCNSDSFLEQATSGKKPGTKKINNYSVINYTNCIFRANFIDHNFIHLFKKILCLGDSSIQYKKREEEPSPCQPVTLVYKDKRKIGGIIPINTDLIVAIHLEKIYSEKKLPVVIYQCDLCPTEKARWSDNASASELVSRHYLPVDHREEFTFDSQDLIIGRSIICDCLNPDDNFDHTCGGIPKTEIKQFFHKVCSKLNTDNNYAMAILSGSPLEPKIHPEYLRPRFTESYTQCRDIVQKTAGQFQHENFSAHYIQQKPSLEYPERIPGHAVYLYNPAFINILD